MLSSLSPTEFNISRKEFYEQKYNETTTKQKTVGGILSGFNYPQTALNDKKKDTWW